MSAQSRLINIEINKDKQFTGTSKPWNRTNLKKYWNRIRCIQINWFNKLNPTSLIVYRSINLRNTSVLAAFRDKQVQCPQNCSVTNIFVNRQTNTESSWSKTPTSNWFRRGISDFSLEQKRIQKNLTFSSLNLLILYLILGFP